MHEAKIVRKAARLMLGPPAELWAARRLRCVPPAVINAVVSAPEAFPLPIGLSARSLRAGLDLNQSETALRIMLAAEVVRRLDEHHLQRRPYPRLD